MSELPKELTTSSTVSLLQPTGENYTPSHLQTPTTFSITCLLLYLSVCSSRHYQYTCAIHSPPISLSPPLFGTRGRCCCRSVAMETRTLHLLSEWVLPFFLLLYSESLFWILNLHSDGWRLEGVSGVCVCLCVFADVERTLSHYSGEVENIYENPEDLRQVISAIYYHRCVYKNTHSHIPCFCFLPQSPPQNAVYMVSYHWMLPLKDQYCRIGVC